MAAPAYIRDAGPALALLPDTASVNAPIVDHVFYALTIVSVAVVLLIGSLIFAFCLRYRASAAVDRADGFVARHGNAIEVAWTVPTLGLFLVAFFWAARIYLYDYRPPAAAIGINVVAKQWMWKIEHENGVREINTLHVPVGQKISLRMTSEDVIHSFFIPDFRLKRDVLPDRYTTFWFEATKPGTYSLFCAEFCGADHSRMRGRIVVMAPKEYQDWLAGQDVGATPAAQGRALFTAYGCSGCHAAGSSVHAPRLEGLFGRPVHLADGETVVADDNYIRDSILLPRKQVAAGYAPIMPSFQGQASESDILKLIAYIKSLAPAGETRP